jgi:hypothetical protein
VDIRLISLYQGKCKQAFVLEIDARSPANDYLRSNEQFKNADFKQLVARVRMVADTPHFRNTEIFKPEGHGLFAFKTRHGLRLYAFFDEDQLLIACYGADKPKRKQPQKDINHAKLWMQRYFDAKKQGVRVQRIP